LYGVGTYYVSEVDAIVHCCFSNNCNGPVIINPKYESYELWNSSDLVTSCYINEFLVETCGGGSGSSYCVV
jgi:hypothetical protein